MVNIITAENKSKFRRQLDSMVEDRKRVFIDLLKWNIAANDGGFEMDQFDDDEAIYLVMSDKSEKHMGSLRLLHSDGPHILGDLFPHLCEGGVPVSADIFEITRLCLSPSLAAAERLRVRNLLISSMIDYALVRGIRAFTGVVSESFLAQILKMGWQCQALGPLQPHGGGKIGAFRIHIDEATPELLQATGIYVPNCVAEFSCDNRAPGGKEMVRSYANADSKAAELWAEQLRKDGYCIIRDVISTFSIAELNRDLKGGFDQTPFCEGDFYGRRTKRFGALLRRSPAVAQFVRHSLILAIADQILGAWCDRINLNLTQAIEIHPGAPAQLPHRDQDMWEGGKGRAEYLLNVIWPLNDFTEANGGTQVWPGSQNTEVLDRALSEEPISVEMKPGDALLFLGSTLHGAGANRTTAARRGIIISYCLGWLKPFENQWLCYPPDVARHFDPELARLVGYSLHKPNLGNYEGQCPSILLQNERQEYLAAIDALRPDQEAALDEFMAEQAAAQHKTSDAIMLDP